MRAVLIGVAATLALSACGGSTAGDPATLIGSSYVVTSITVDGAEREVLGPVAIAFTADAVGVDTPCNDMGSSIEYAATTLTVGPIVATEMACETPLMEQDSLIADMLAADPTWQAADGTLTLTSGATTITANRATT